MLRVGLTGGIGAGKSAVSRLLAARGAVIIDADRLAREAVEPGTVGYDEVVAAFGAGVVAADGSLDREALADRVFADEAARKKLERIVHPRVRSRAHELEAGADADAVVVHDMALLVETDAAGRFDVVVVVDLPEDEAVRRLIGRGMRPEDAKRRIDTQAGREQRLAAADIVVDNSREPAALAEQVDVLWTDLKHRAARISRR